MDGIGWALSAMSAAQTRLDVAAANLANGATDGFRRATLRGRLGADGVTMVRAADSAQGALRHTGRPYDLALTGPGTFRVRAADGAVERTRYGAFSRDLHGILRDVQGRALLGHAGPVRVPEGATIDTSGRVTQNGRVIDRIPLAGESSLRTGFLESSNVDTIAEMIDVLTAQRSFESAQKALTSIDQTRERAATQVAQVRA